jgi:nucleotide-binding universal stress UspA family protein
LVFLVCVDGSDTASTVVDHAIAQARAWDAGLHALHVFQPPVTTYALEPNFALQLEDLEEAERQAVWAPITPRLDASDVSWIRADRVGYPVSEIIDYARETSAELIVIGTRGRGEFVSLVLGSTSHGVIQQAPCDVLVVRAGT